jgi:hypothetical protein
MQPHPKAAGQDGKSVPHAPEKPAAPTKSKKQLDKELDNALADSFPASDPPAASHPTGNEPAGDPRTKP